MGETGAMSAEPTVTIDWGTAYELLIGLFVFGYERTPSAFDVGPGWFAGIQSRASATLLSGHSQLEPSDWLWLRLLVMAAERRDRSRALRFQEFDHWLQAIEPWRLYVRLLGGGPGRAGPVTSAVVQDAVRGDRSARQTIRRILFPQSPGTDGSLEHVLALPPERVKALIVQITNCWYADVFRDGETVVAARLAAEARATRTIGKTVLTRLLPAAAVGFHYVPHRAISQVVLIPSIVCRPSVLTTRSGSTRIFFYPIADEPPDSNEQSAQLVRLHHALADRERLLTLRALVQGKGTLTSLSQELGLPVDRLGAQLMILRNARLITVHMSEQGTTYAIRENLAAMVYRTLTDYLPECDSGMTQQLA